MAVSHVDEILICDDNTHTKMASVYRDFFSDIMENIESLIPPYSKQMAKK